MPSLLILACALALAPPQDLRGEIEVPGGRGLAITPSGDLWLGSRDGRVYVSRDWNGSWSEVDVGARSPDELDLGGDEIEHLRFFDSERAILAGYVGGEEKDEILRTTDSGRTWTRVKLGHALMVYDAHVLPDGHGWLVGSSGTLLASSDFGATWRVAGRPFDGRARSRSVFFSSAEVGCVGALHNALKLTSDGGRTWVTVRTPRDEGLIPDAGGDERAPVVGVWSLGPRLVVRQCERLFHRTRSAEGAWREVDLGGRAVVGAALDSDRLVVVTDDLRVSWLSKELELSPASAAPLDDRPFTIATGARGVAFLTDVRGRVCTLADGTLECSRMYTRDDEPSWPIAAFDRTADGALFGVSYGALYRSRDAGRSWERLAEAESLRDVWVAENGGHALVLAHRGTWLWRGAELEPVPLGVKLLAFSVQARERQLWIATAFEAAEDEETQAMLYTTDTVLRGPGFRAFLYSSVDEGLTWKRIAEQAGAIVSAAWLGDEGFLRLCLTDGTIRGGTIDAHDGTLVGGELALVSSKQHSYGGEWATWLAFPDAETGWIGGQNFFEGACLARTSDGGRTWNEIEPAPDGWTEAFRLAGGACVRVHRGSREPNRIELWQAGEFRETRRFEARVNDARVDASGCLLVRFESGAAWSLAADGVTWSEVGTIQLPPR